MALEDVEFRFWHHKDIDLIVLTQHALLSMVILHCMGYMFYNVLLDLAFSSFHHYIEWVDVKNIALQYFD
jgi:hypothetical protein